MGVNLNPLDIHPDIHYHTQDQLRKILNGDLEEMTSFICADLPPCFIESIYRSTGPSSTPRYTIETCLKNI